MTLKIYHNPRCKKSRAGLEYLKEKHQDIEIVDYIKESLSRKELEEILLKINKKPEELVRTQEEAYKRELKGKNFTKDEWIEIFIENPKLLHRPIVVGKRKAVLAQPPEELDRL